MVGSLLGGLLPDPTIRRIVLWQTFGQLITAALGPYFRELEYAVNARTPNAALSPSELAVMVVRGFRAEASAAAEAQKAGLNGERFHELVNIAGQAPAPIELAVAERRGIIPHDAGDAEGIGFIQGIAQGNLANKWGPMLQALATAIPSPESALEALLEGQTDHDTAVDLYKRFGGDPQYFELMYNTRGSAPTPVEAGALANRGIIPWEGSGPDAVSFEQAFLEGPWRNKWLPAMREYAQYRPPPRTVTAMVREGALTDAEALVLFRNAGLSEEMAASYLRAAHLTKTAAAKDLARTTVEALYRDRLVERAQAVDFLDAIGYSAEEAGFILAIQDVALQQATISSVISRVRALYTGYKITRDTAASSLDTLGVTGDRQADVIALWDLQRVDQMRALTEAQVVGAFFYNIITQDEAQAHLQQIGYTPHDAWILLSQRKHEPLPGEPPRTAVGAAPGFQT